MFHDHMCPIIQTTLQDLRALFLAEWLFLQFFMNTHKKHLWISIYLFINCFNATSLNREVTKIRLKRNFKSANHVWNIFIYHTISYYYTDYLYYFPLCNRLQKNYKVEYQVNSDCSSQYFHICCIEKPWLLKKYSYIC